MISDTERRKVARRLRNACNALGRQGFYFDQNMLNLIADYIEPND